MEVDIKVDLDLKADGLSSPVIDLSDLHNVAGSIIMPDVVNQKLDGDGNQFNIDQINNLVDIDFSHASLSYDGKGGDVKMDAKAEGGDVKIDFEDRRHHRQFGERRCGKCRRSHRPVGVQPDHHSGCEHPVQQHHHERGWRRF